MPELRLSPLDGCPVGWGPDPIWLMREIPPLLYSQGGSQKGSGERIGENA